MRIGGIEAGDAATGKTWRATLFPTAEQVDAESAELQLVPAGGLTGTGTIALYWGDAPAEQVNSTSGTLSVTFGHGQVQGTATAVPDELSGTFQSSSLVLNCAVPPSVLADAGGDPGPVPEPTDASMGVGVQDKDLITPFCASLRHLITP